MQPRLDNGRRPHAVYHQHDVVAYQDCRNEEFGMGVESVYHTGYQPSALVVDFRTHAVGGHKGYFRTGKQCGKYERYCRYGYPGEHDGFCLLVLVVLVGPGRKGSLAGCSGRNGVSSSVCVSLVRALCDALTGAP